MTVRALLLCAVWVTFTAAGLSTGVPVYYALSAAAGALLLLSLPSALVLRATLKANVRCSSVRVTRGTSAAFGVSLKHSCLLPVSPVRIHITTPSGSEACEFACPPFKATSRSFNCDCPHRGLYELKIEYAECSDIFGLFTFKKKFSGHGRVIEVLPAAHEGIAMELSAGDTGPEAPNRSAEDDAAPSGLREWRDGDELKKVHWKLSLRRRQLTVRTYEESARPDFLIFLDLSPIEALRGRKLAIEDAACDEAASAALTQLNAGYPVRMPLACSEPVECTGRSAADLPAFLSALANAKFDSSYPFEQTLSYEMRRLQRTGGAVIVTGRLTTRVADMAIQMRRGGMRIAVRWINESAGQEGGELTARLAVYGIEVRRIDPYDEV